MSEDPNNFFHVYLSDLDIELSRIPIEALLRHYGIDPTKPYRGRPDPHLKAHVYTQHLRDVLPAVRERYAHA